MVTDWDEIRKLEQIANALPRELVASANGTIESYSPEAIFILDFVAKAKGRRRAKPGVANTFDTRWGMIRSIWTGNFGCADARPSVGRAAFLFTKCLLMIVLRLEREGDFAYDEEHMVAAIGDYWVGDHYEFGVWHQWEEMQIDPRLFGSWRYVVINNSNL